jgi:SpoVK/Ycf46/Vps4 family AAA+-type ATPase
MRKKRKISSPPSPKEYRIKRLKTEQEWTIYKKPDSIETIDDLIAFTYTYTDKHININRLKAIIPHLRELNGMVGLTSVKKVLIDMIMHFSQGQHRKNEDYLHMVVYGPPGCGKTSLCRILGKILSGLGILPKDTFTIVKRTDLIAKYLGQTAHRTEELLKKCLGGVMFIDEAYSLAPKHGDHDSFAKEAIDFLNQFLSDHKDDLVCIVAGYEEELNATFFAVNPGMKSRFPWRFKIEPYTNKELFEIFKRMVQKDGFTIEENSINDAFFGNNKEYFTFAGRDIENFIAKCKYIHTRNTFGLQPNKIFSSKDINQGFAEHKKHQVQVDKGPPPGMFI